MWYLIATCILLLAIMLNSSTGPAEPSYDVAVKQTQKPGEHLQSNTDQDDHFKDKSEGDVVVTETKLITITRTVTRTALAETPSARLSWRKSGGCRQRSPSSMLQIYNLKGDLIGSCPDTSTMRKSTEVITRFCWDTSVIVSEKPFDSSLKDITEIEGLIKQLKKFETGMLSPSKKHLLMSCDGRESQSFSGHVIRRLNDCTMLALLGARRIVIGEQRWAWLFTAKSQSLQCTAQGSTKKKKKINPALSETWGGSSSSTHAVWLPIGGCDMANVGRDTLGVTLALYTNQKPI
ncbi:hypothetical protein FA15DRAFT_698630 [Coprinopsis marcescibilis]|uniref:Uncharacterized protein n=1 Tax=Coprinopsis marcescibilis TaxID=230819 RepID=A0A5C3KAM9_COPMA|nr:hypothetical protein FA15DRAFT_698630 [Coprinopsis marcescibilis]